MFSLSLQTDLLALFLQMSLCFSQKKKNSFKNECLIIFQLPPPRGKSEKTVFMEILKSWVKLSTCISTDFVCLFVCFRRQGGFQMLNKCELRQEHISSFQEPKAQVSLNKRAQIPQRTRCNSCNRLEAFSVSQINALALPSLLPLQAGLKVAAETSPLFFFGVPSAREAGQGLTPQPRGSWSSMSLSRVVVLPLYVSCKTWSLGFAFLSHWYGNKNIHYSLEEERFSNHWLMVSASERSAFPPQASQGREMQSHTPPGNV